MGEQKKLVAKFADRFSMEPAKMWQTLKATAFKQRDGSAPTDEQMAALLVVADQYGLNPFTKEVYAFPDQNGGIVPVVSVDGWTRIINQHPAMDGLEFRWAEDVTTPDGGQRCPEWCEVVIYRKDRGRPTVVREYLDEVYRPPFRKNGYEKAGPWQSHTKRFLRHKALIQGARVGFGFAGIYDKDEAERIIEGEASRSESAPATLSDQSAVGALEHQPSSGTGLAGLKQKLSTRQPETVPAEPEPEAEAPEPEPAPEPEAGQGRG